MLSRHSAQNAVCLWELAKFVKQLNGVRGRETPGLAVENADDSDGVEARG